jgi:carbamoyl-phosphate synthase large subunit
MMLEPSKISSGRGEVRVAITGVSGDVGFGAILGLRAGKVSCWILGLDFNDDCAGSHLCDAYRKVKPVIDPDFIGKLEDLLVEHKIQLLLCGVDSEVPLIAKWRNHLQQRTGCRVVVAEEGMVRMFADKFDTTIWLEQHGLNPPNTWLCNSDSTFEEFSPRLPMVAKPRQGNASKGLYFLRTDADLERFLVLKKIDYCLQEFLEGPEYTCGLLFDSEGNLRDWMSARRELDNGKTMMAEVVDSHDIDAFIQRFASQIHFEGPMNLQLKIGGDGQPKVFEVNPRLSGSTSMRIAVGFNDPARIVAHWLFDDPIMRASVRRAKIFRYLTELVISSDAGVGA